MRTVIFARLSVEDAKKGFSLPLIKKKLQEHCEKNGLLVLKTFEAIENGDLGESPTLLEILNFVAVQEEKIILLLYYPSSYNDQTEIGQKLQNLIAAQKIEVQHYCHPCFKEPSNDTVKIWRYINLAKFIDLIQTKTLFFTRADFLREMDKNEGVYLTKFSQQLNTLLSEKKIVLPEGFPFSTEEFINMQANFNSYNEQTTIRQMFINCWHISDHENFAMWKIYSELFGICVESTYQKLYSSFIDEKWSFYNQRSKIYIGEVIYIDRTQDVIPQGNAFWPIMHKGVEFSYEKELRCIVWGMQNQCENIKIKVDLDKLIQKIHISPFAPHWFKLAVDDLCSKYVISPEKVCQSNLT